MPKLTEKTMKEGQKCVLTTKTPLFCDYKSVRLPWDDSDNRRRMTEKLPELLTIPNIAYNLYNEEYVKVPGERNYDHFIELPKIDPSIYEPLKNVEEVNLDDDIWN